MSLETSISSAVLVDNGWLTNVSDQVEMLPSSAVSDGIDILREWQSLFPLANTWVGKEHGVPSLFVRIDGVIDAEGRWKVFEVEERPCGIGMTALINPVFRELLTELKEKHPPIKWVQSDYRVTDDHRWFGSGLTLTEAFAEREAKLLVRSRPEEVAYHALEDRSVSSVSEEGNKSYGLRLGWWDTVTVRVEEGGEDTFLDPPLSGPCVLKPLVGTRARLVKPYFPIVPGKNVRRPLHSYRSSDFETVRQIVKAIMREPGRTMYRQPFIEHMQFSHQPDKNGMYRFFYGYDPGSKDWVPLGGVWMALDSTVVHGTDRTISGPLHFVH